MTNHYFVHYNVCIYYTPSCEAIVCSLEQKESHNMWGFTVCSCIFGCSSGDVLRKIVSVVSASGMGGGKGSGKEGGEGAVRLPPLLEEELSLTASRAIV